VPQLQGGTVAGRAGARYKTVATMVTKEISWREGDTQTTCPLDAIHRFVVRGLVAHYIEVEDLHFNHDSAVLLADYRDTSAADDDASEDAQDDAQEVRITAIAVLAATYEHLQRHPAKQVLVTGHTDKSGSDSYNLALSKKRADNVLALLQGNRDAWVSSCLAQTKVEDHQQLLKWLYEDHAWDTDPGTIDNETGPNTEGAIQRFKETFNTEFSASIPVNTRFDEEAWRAMHQIYERELLESMGWTQAELDGVRQNLVLVDSGAVGCGENWPVTGENRSRIDRRVEIVFFDPSEVPPLPLACHPSPTQCNPPLCDFRNPGLYALSPLPVEPVLAPRFRVLVHLLLVWKDPDGVDHLFAQGMTAHIEFGDGRAPLDVAVDDAGIVHFIADKRSQSFTLSFVFSGVQYFASAPAAAPEPERIVPEAEVAELVRTGWRVWRLPERLDLDTCDWQVDAATAPTYTAPNFTALETLSEIGTADAPCRCELLPHWQYLQLTYFDRKLKQRLSVVPLTFEGFFDKAASSGPPDTQSNWTTHPGACQALPWVVRKRGGNPVNEPDADTLLQVRCKAASFIDSRATDRVLISKNPGAASSDPGLNGGADDPFDMTKPSGERLAFYDLPPLWKSRAYFCKVGARQGRYETLATEPTTDAAPVRFSLDDIVLATQTGSAAPTPLAWTPDAQPTNRIALFSHTFAGGADLSTVGLYKPDTANNLSFFTTRPTVETDRNYIADYPDWTRLVIVQGNAFDVFDQRVVVDPDGVVGARAAIRHVDVTVSPHFRQHIGLHASGELEPRPAAIDRAFFSIQPMYEQRHHQWWRPSNRTHDRGIGRYDQILVRCSDVEADGVTEVARCVSYFRFFFNFAPTFTANNNTTAVGAALTGATAASWVETAISGLLRRWNGPDGAMNPGPASIEPKTAAQFKSTTLWFAQDLPSAIAHYELGIFREPAGGKVRAYMSASSGQGALDTSDNVAQVSGWFTFAHETGHGASLHDEYVEPTTRTNLLGNWLDSFDSFSPGSPYVRDTRTMMVQNMTVDTRDHWHVAEWLRTRLGNTQDFVIRHGTHSYEIPHHSETPAKNHVCWPLREDINRVVSGRPHSHFDAFLYPLGDDRFATTALPTRVGKPGAFDGILVVVVKLRFEFHIAFDATTRNNIHNFLTGVRDQIILRYCDRYFVTGTAAGRTFARALLDFSPRFWVRNPGQDYSSEDPQDDDEHIEISMKASGPPEWDSGLFSDDHELHFPFNQPAHVFAQTYFADMVGVTSATVSDPSAFTTIVQGVFPGGTVHAL